MISSETLCEPRAQPLNSIQTIGTGIKAYMIGEHTPQSVLKGGPIQSVLTKGKRGHDKLSLSPPYRKHHTFAWVVEMNDASQGIVFETVIVEY